MPPRKVDKIMDLKDISIAETSSKKSTTIEQTNTDTAPPCNDKPVEFRRSSRIEKIEDEIKNAKRKYLTERRKSKRQAKPQEHDDQCVDDDTAKPARKRPRNSKKAAVQKSIQKDEDSQEHQHEEISKAHKPAQHKPVQGSTYEEKGKQIRDCPEVYNPRLHVRLLNANAPPIQHKQQPINPQGASSSQHPPPPQPPPPIAPPPIAPPPLAPPPLAPPPLAPPIHQQEQRQYHRITQSKKSKYCFDVLIPKFLYPSSWLDYLKYEDSQPSPRQQQQQQQQHVLPLPMSALVPFGASFPSQKEAAEASDKALIAMWGKLHAEPYLNFPLETYGASLHRKYGHDISDYLLDICAKGKASMVKARELRKVEKRKPEEQQYFIAKKEFFKFKDKVQKAINLMRKYDPDFLDTTKPCGSCPACRQPWKKQKCIMKTFAREQGYHPARLAELRVVGPLYLGLEAAWKKCKKEGNEERAAELRGEMSIEREHVEQRVKEVIQKFGKKARKKGGVDRAQGKGGTDVDFGDIDHRSSSSSEQEEEEEEDESDDDTEEEEGDAGQEYQMEHNNNNNNNIKESNISADTSMDSEEEGFQSKKPSTLKSAAQKVNWIEKPVPYGQRRRRFVEEYNKLIAKNEIAIKDSHPSIIKGILDVLKGEAAEFEFSRGPYPNNIFKTVPPQHGMLEQIDEVAQRGAKEVVFLPDRENDFVAAQGLGRGGGGDSAGIGQAKCTLCRQEHPPQPQFCQFLRWTNAREGEEKPLHLQTEKERKKERGKLPDHVWFPKHIPAPWLDNVAPATQQLMVAFQNLATAAIKDFNRPMLANVYTPSTLLAVGMIAEEFIKCELRSHGLVDADGDHESDEGGGVRGGRERETPAPPSRETQMEVQAAVHHVAEGMLHGDEDIDSDSEEDDDEEEEEEEEV